MSDHLPEQVSEWPNDPYELLGVSPNEDPKALRKAYVRLIRKFKPEQFPDEFQRIRSAYELATRTGSGTDGFSGFHSSTAAPAASESNYQSNQSSQADAAWDAAKTGNFYEAKSILESLLTAQPDDEYVISRLYWVKKIDPEENEEAIFCWLCRIAMRSSESSHVWPLLISESECGHPELLSADFAALLGTTAALPHMNWLLSSRWGEAVRQVAWETIASDVRQLSKDHPTAKSDTAFCAGLYALQYLIWSDRKSNKCFSEVAEAVSGAKRWLTENNQNELQAMIAVREEWIQCRRLPAIATQLMRETLTGSAASSRTRIEFLRQLNTVPGKWLKLFDKLEVKNPLVMHWLFRCMADIEPPKLDTERNKVLSALISKFLWLNNPELYTESRLNLAKFCIINGVQLEQVAEKMAIKQKVLIKQRRDLGQRHIEKYSELIMVDRPIHCLVHGMVEWQMMMA